MLNTEPFTRIYTATQDFYGCFPLLDLQNLINQSHLNLCCGQSAGTVFCKLYTIVKLFKYFLDTNALNGMNRIVAAMDTYAEIIRLDPSNLVSDTPYNELIFKNQV